MLREDERILKPEMELVGLGQVEVVGDPDERIFSEWYRQARLD